MSETIEVKVPDIGDFKDVPVIEVLVKPGDEVSAEDSLITVESDKATMEVPSPARGVVKELRVKVGDKVSQGSPVLVLESASDKDGAARGSEAEAPQQPPGKASAPTAAAPGLQGTAPAEPKPAAAERAAPPAPAPREAVDEGAVGKAHASLKQDVQGFVKSELSRPRGAAAAGLNLLPLPQIDFAKFGAVTSQSLSRIRKLAGANLHRNWVTIPHVTQHEEADITELEAFRKSQAEEAKKQGIRFTILGFLMKAAVVALREFPEFNASLAPDGESLVLKQYFHIGVAVDTPNGLVVPVIRDVDKKGLLEVARELGEASERMRAGKIAPNDLQGGCFSISSLGGIGGTLFTPIINAPEVAILGVGKAMMKPVWNGADFAPRLMLPLSLSYDHRVIDGASGARFISFLSSVLGDIRKLVL
jgi:pyruvate dehydrogenase E2 component (dihydrolipoamide acetyltransferase)